MVDIQAAINFLHTGKLVAFPTETVYGLGADATNSKAVEQIFLAKGRPVNHPVIVHLASVEQIHDWARNVPALAYQLAQQLWPGPLTLVLPRAFSVSDIITGGQDTIGLRIPAHPTAQELLRAFGKGIAAPSANRFGRISPTCAEHVQRELGSSVSLILDGGACPLGIESTIIDFSQEQARLLRPGAVSVDQITRIIGNIVLPGESSQTPRVSGNLLNHYAPHTKLQLISTAALPQLRTVLGQGIKPPIAILAQSAYADFLDARIHWVAMPQDPAAYAKALYARLHELDQMHFSCILVENVPQTSAWLAIQDRLTKAAHKGNWENSAR